MDSATVAGLLLVSAFLPSALFLSLLMYSLFEFRRPESASESEAAYQRHRQKKHHRSRKSTDSLPAALGASNGLALFAMPLTQHQSLINDRSMGL